MSKQTIDVSQLSGWSGLSEGTQAVTVKTIVNGVENSASSNVVTVEKTLTKQTKEVSLLMVDGDQTILPDANMTMEKAIVKKPATLIPSNIRQGVSIGGVVGEMTGTGKEEVEVSEALDMSNGNQIIPPPDNTKTMSKVTIIKPNTFIAQNIKNGVEIGGITGTYTPEIQIQEKKVTITENGSFTVVPDNNKFLTKVSGTVNVPTSGGGGGLNVEFGDNSPADTSKMWFQEDETNTIEFGVDESKQIETIFPLHVNAASFYSNRDVYSAAVGTKIYLFGLKKGSSDEISNAIVIFHTQTKTTSKLSVVLPLSLYEMCCAVVGTNIYLFGGYVTTKNVSNSIFKFDTLTNTVSTITTATLANPAYSIGCAAVGTKIYLFGGEGVTTSYDTIQVFDTETETITTLSTKLNTAVYWVCAVPFEQSIYLFGHNLDQEDTILKFNTTNNSISTLNTTMVDEGSGIRYGSAVFDNYIFLFPEAFGNGVLKFNTATEKFETVLGEDGNAGDLGRATSVVGNIAYHWYSILSFNCFAYNFDLPQGQVYALQEFDGFYYSNRHPEHLFNVVAPPTKVTIDVKNVYIGNSQNKARFANAYLFESGKWVNINTDNEVPQMPAPIISLVNNTTIQIDTISEMATKIEVFADGVSIGEVEKETSTGYTLTVGSISKTDNPDTPVNNDFGTLTLFKNGSSTGEVIDLLNLQNSDILAQGVTSIKFTYEASSGRYGNSSCSISSIKLGGTLSMGTVYQVTENIDDIIIATTSKADAPAD